MHELTIFQELHNRTVRDYLGRMQDGKVESMVVSRRFDFEYWDGDRRFGYGGYRYDGRWETVARQLIQQYCLDNTSSVLDVGCGKGHLLYELAKLLPGIKVTGFDLSDYALSQAPEEIRSSLVVHKAQDIPYHFVDKQFDLVLSLTTLHNLPIYEFKQAICEIERVAKAAYIVLDSYRNEEELFNLQCWGLTCELFFRPDEWVWLFKEYGYSGDYEFIYFC